MADNNTKNKTCPICNSTNDPKAAFCNKCGWEFKILVASDSNYAKQEKEREEKMKAFIAQCNKATNTSEDSESLKAANNKIAILEKKLDEAKKEIANLKSSPITSTSQPQMVAIMSLTNSRSEVTKYLPIYDGMNTFGSDKSNQKHQQINIALRGNPIKPKHFVVEHREKRLILAPLDGSEIFCNGNAVPSSGTKVYPQDIVSISDVLEIHLSLL